MNGALVLTTDLDGFERISQDSLTVLVRPEWKGWLLDDLLRDFQGVPADARRVYAHGRVKHFSYRPQGAPARVFVRRASRGGLLGTVLGGLYAGGGRPIQELRAVQAARAAGVSVPEPLAVVARAAGPFYRLSLVSREIEGASDLLSLAGTLAPAEKRDLLRRVADEMRRLHEAGVYHADLTMKNILVAGDAVYIIDLDKALLTGRRDGRLDVANLSRLNRSIVKLFGGAGTTITRTDKIRFLLRYLGARDRVKELSTLCSQGLWAHRLWWTLSGQS